MIQRFVSAQYIPHLDDVYGLKSKSHVKAKCFGLLFMSSLYHIHSLKDCHKPIQFNEKLMYTIRHTTAFIAHCQGLQLKVKCLSAILGRSISPIVLKNFMHLGS